MQTANNFTQSWKVSKITLDISLWYLNLEVLFNYIEKPETELEKQVAEILQSSENNLKDQKLLTEAELKAIKAMNLDEVGFFG